MYLALCFVTGSGLLIGYRLAPCSRGGSHGCTLLGLDRHGWGTWHLWAAYLMLVLLVVHLVLNYSFIRNVVAVKSRAILMALTLAGAAIVVWFAVAPVTVEEGGRTCGSSCESGEEDFVCPRSASCGATCGEGEETESE